MDIPEDPQERKKWMMQLLQDYGREFLIFEPEDQPNVFAAPEPEYRELRSGNLDPSVEPKVLISYSSNIVRSLTTGSSIASSLQWL